MSTDIHQTEKMGWDVSHRELITTRFMRNRALLQTLTEDLIPKLASENGRANILFIGASEGCEVYSLRFLLGAHTKHYIWGLDIDQDVVGLARKALYSPDYWTPLSPTAPVYLTEEEVAKLFRFHWWSFRDERRYKIAKPYRTQVQFSVGDMFSLTPDFFPHSFDIVCCINLLLHFSKEYASRAIECMEKFVAPAGALVISGCNPEVKSETTEALNFHPYLENYEDIAALSAGVAWLIDDPRPTWAYPPPEKEDSNYYRKIADIFTRGIG